MSELSFQRHVHVSRPVRRLVLLLVGGIAFLGIASVIKPSPRSADASTPDTVGPDGFVPPPRGVDPKMKEFQAAIREAFVTPVDINSTDPKEQELVRRLKDRKLAGADSTADHKLLGILESRQHTVHCFQTSEGVRYTVYTRDGRLLQKDLPADEVYRAFPDVDLQTLHADPPDHDGAMLWDSAADWRD